MIGRSTAFTAMTAAAQNLPITADMAMEPQGSGTRLIMKCEYKGEAGTRRSYKLMVVPKGGSPEKATDWSAGQGDEFAYDGHTTLKPTEIDRVEIWSADNRVLMVYRP